MNQYSFPANFIWGSATASYQIEGAIQEDGRTESIWDRFSHTPGKVLKNDTGDIACDHYHRFQEDVALMSKLGFQGYRFSLAWPRIIPEEKGRPNQKGLDFYDRLVDVLLESGIEPLPTLYHWDLPQYLQDKGGWANRDTAYRFVEYSGVVFDRLSDRIPRWITHNEPWVAAFMGHYLGQHAPGIQDLQTALKVAHHLLLSHGLVVQQYRSMVGRKGEIGITVNINDLQPASQSELDQKAAVRADGEVCRWFLDPIYVGAYPRDIQERYERFGCEIPGTKGDFDIITTPIDFLGLNYYTRSLIRHSPGQGPLEYEYAKPQGPTTTMGWEIYPEGLYNVLSRLKRDYRPRAIYITENGASFEDQVVGGKIHDQGRIDYLKEHFVQAHRAICDGVPLKGYYVWSLLDNFEWALGYSKRFGLIWVDFETQQRIPKDSAEWYSSVIRENRVLEG